MEMTEEEKNQGTIDRAMEIHDDVIDMLQERKATNHEVMIFTARLLAELQLEDPSTMDAFNGLVHRLAAFMIEENPTGVLHA